MKSGCFWLYPKPRTVDSDVNLTAAVSFTQEAELQPRSLSKAFMTLARTSSGSESTALKSSSIWSALSDA